MGTSGSEGGPEKPTSCKAGWAPRSDPYTEHCTSEGTVHCCAMLDVYSRMIVGWSIADHMRTDWSSMPCRWRVGDGDRHRALSVIATRAIHFLGVRAPGCAKPDSSARWVGWPRWITR